MTLREKQAALAARWRQHGGPQERLAAIAAGAKALPGLPEEERTEANRIEGCLAKLWFVAELREGRCHFRCDSDSLVAKGIAAVLCESFSGGTPGEILACETDFLKELGITQHLTPNRRNGLSRLSERIRAFARSHQTPAA